MLTKKDFKAVAEIINKHTGRSAAYFNGIHRPEVTQTVQRITDKLADYFTTQNPRFDRSRFMRACGLTE